MPLRVPGYQGVEGGGPVMGLRGHSGGEKWVAGYKSRAAAPTRAQHHLSTQEPQCVCTSSSSWGGLSLSLVCVGRMDSAQGQLAKNLALLTPHQ